RPPCPGSLRARVLRPQDGSARRSDAAVRAAPADESVRAALSAARRGRRRRRSASSAPAPLPPVARGARFSVPRPAFPGERPFPVRPPARRRPLLVRHALAAGRPGRGRFARGPDPPPRRVDRRRRRRRARSRRRVRPAAVVSARFRGAVGARALRRPRVRDGPRLR
ncbi:hypothetical protein OY671_011174, partial [Metschnikowia pulcherrima]